MKGGFSMLNPSFTFSLAQSISEAILAPAIRHTEDVTHIHVLLDALQKIRDPRYHAHPDFTTGYAYGQTCFCAHAPACPITLDEVIAMVRDNLARHDHEDLNVFYRLMGCPTIDYAYRVGFVFGWLTAVIDHGVAPIYPTISHVALCK
jgi:hypothetical protein